MSSFSSFKNRGMLLEDIINKSINFYLSNKIAYFNKQTLNIKFDDINNNKIQNGYIKSKSTVDYYGVYKGKYITFEAKSTELDFLPLSNIKKHQHEHLLLISNLNGWAFYLIYFKRMNKFFLINANKIDYENKKAISYEEIASNGIELELIFPGIIDFLIHCP